MGKASKIAEKPLTLSRRRFLTLGAATTAFVVTPKMALSLLPPPKTCGAERSLQLYNIHTGETFSQVYWKNGDIIPSAAQELNRLLRDRRNGQLTAMNPQLFDLLHKLSVDCGGTKPFNIICGYRSPVTNAKLHAQSKGVAKNSRHMTGDAIDLSLPGVKLRDLQQAAIGLQMGGVGYYAQSNFIHVDIRENPARWG